VSSSAEPAAPGGVRPVRLGLDPALEANGFNVAGAVSIERYDGLVPPRWRAAVRRPGARHAIVLAAGGPEFFRAFRRSPEASGRSDHPVDDFARRIVDAAARPAGTASYYWQRHGGRYADFVELGRAAGLGSPGRLGLLLHPEYGPWLAIRAVVLWDRALELAPSAALAPGAFCAECPAPCAGACPGGALPSEGFDPVACLGTRRQRSDCAVRCAARHACVIGGEHAYDPDGEEYFGRAALREAVPVK